MTSRIFLPVVICLPTHATHNNMATPKNNEKKNLRDVVLLQTL
jgi:hypothetical protein